MFDETNQAEMPESLFEETEVTESAPEVEQEESLSTDSESVPDETDAAEETPDEPQEQPEQTVQVKYNGDVKDIPLSEAVTLAQKGMNYDHVLEERDSKYKREIDVLERYAIRSGMTRDQYVAYLEKTEGDYAIENEVERLRGSYPDADEGLLRELAKKEVAIKDKETELQRQNQAKVQEETEQKPWKDFFAKYPDIKPEELTQDLYDAIADGATPTEAYQQKKIAELQEKLAISEKTVINKQKSPGSAIGDASEKERDDFLEGFLI